MNNGHSNRGDDDTDGAVVIPTAITHAVLHPT